MNYIKIELGGKERGCKLGLGFLERVQKSENVTLEKVFSDINTATLLFHSLAFNCERTGETLDFDKFDVYDWIDEIGLLHQTIKNFQAAFFRSFAVHLQPEQQQTFAELADDLEGNKKPQKKAVAKK